MSLRHPVTHDPQSPPSPLPGLIHLLQTNQLVEVEGTSLLRCLTDTAMLTNHTEIGPMCTKRNTEI